MRKDYRTGTISALIGIYENVVLEIAARTEQITEEDFQIILDASTADEDCRSIQTIVSHVVSAGFSYADYIRETFSITTADKYKKRLLSQREAVKELKRVVNYTAECFQGKWEMNEQEISATIFNTGWGKTYDLEQLLEHAIVHFLRYERQIKRFMARYSGEQIAAAGNKILAGHGQSEYKNFGNS